MINEFKYQCLHCTKKFKVPTRLAGKLIKCPFCQQQLRLPKVTISAEDYDMLAATRRTVLPKRKKFPTQLVVKWSCVVLVVYFAYHSYIYYQIQNSKDIAALIAEYEKNPDNRTYFFIKKNFSRQDTKILWQYIHSPEKHIRVIVAECFSKIAYSEQVYEVLKEYLLKDKFVEVRIATANTCGEIQKRKIIEMLVTQLEEENHPEVKSAIAQALRKVTGVRGNTVNEQRWEIWWKENQQNYPD